MGGAITVQSEEGKGSTFTFEVPLGTLPVGKEPKPRRIGDGVRVLIVDDHAGSRLALRDLVDSAGAEAVLAETGEQALGLVWCAREPQSRFQLVLLDSTLPDADGFTVASRMRREPSVEGPIVMLVPAHDIAGHLSRCVDLGLSSCLTKPVEQSELFEAIWSALGTGAAPVADSGEKSPTEIRANARPAPESETAGGKPRVLLVEDDRINRMFLAALCEREGWGVTNAVTGKAALEAFESGAFDLVLMDVQMPEMDGLEATRAIRMLEGERGRVPIIGITAHALERDKERCLTAGMDAHLTKPVDPEELVSVAECLLRQEPEGSHSEPRSPADLSRVRKALGDDTEQLAARVSSFVETSSAQLQELREAAENGDAGRLASGAHTLKGSLTLFEAEEARTLAKELERLGETNQLDEALAVIEKLERELARVADFLSC